MPGIGETMGQSEERATELRHRLLEAATTLIAEHGLESLSLRKVATRINASTMVVYTAFGNKSALLVAVAQKSLNQIYQTMATVAGPPSVHHIIGLARAYRLAALQNPVYYEVLQSGLTRQAVTTLSRSSDAYMLLLNAVQVGVTEGWLVGSSAEAVCDGLWAVVHGAVSLELGGHWDNPDVAEARFEECGLAALRGFSNR